MADDGTRKLRVDVDGVREIDDGRSRRVVRLVVTTSAVVAALVVIVTATTMLTLRRAPATQTARDRSPAQSEVAAATGTGQALPATRGDGLRPVPLSKPAAASRESRRAARPRSARPASAARHGVPDPVAAAPGEQPAAGEREDGMLEGLVDDYVDKLRASGNGEGLAAFPPKGTNPPKTGLVVPEDFELPEGYVRYYQVTDDGRRLDAILMFSPDYEFVDSSGKPIALPEDGIVPPDMAPPGLPGRMLDVPDTAPPPG